MKDEAGRCCPVALMTARGSVHRGSVAARLWGKSLEIRDSPGPRERVLGWPGVESNKNRAIDAPPLASSAGLWLYSTPLTGTDSTSRPHPPAVFTKEGSPMAAESEFSTVLGPDVFVKGELSFEKAVRLQGRIEGSVRTPGKLHIDREAKVQAD